MAHQIHVPSHRVSLVRGLGAKENLPDALSLEQRAVFERVLSRDVLAFVSSADRYSPWSIEWFMEPRLPRCAGPSAPWA
jgi:hypothetical protein